MARHIITGAGAPSVAPEHVGQHYIDMAAGDHYLAVGTTSASDWKKVGSGGGLSGYGAPVPHQALTKSGTQWFWDVAANPLSRVVTADGDTDLLLQLPEGTDKHYQGRIIFDNRVNSMDMSMAVDPAETGTWTIHRSYNEVTDTSVIQTLYTRTVYRVLVQIHLDASGHRNVIIEASQFYTAPAPE